MEWWQISVNIPMWHVIGIYVVAIAVWLFVELGKGL